VARELGWVRSKKMEGGARNMQACWAWGKDCNPQKKERVVFLLIAGGENVGKHDNGRRAIDGVKAT